MAAPLSVPNTPGYRVVHGAADEGPAFLDALDRIARFYTTVMGGRVRDDGPGIRLKWSRDWEYPWVFTRAAAAPGVRILDCGAGNSPVPYLMAQEGASVVALDRDAVVASRARYAGMVARDWCRGVVGLPASAAAASHEAAPTFLAHAAAARPRESRPLPVRAWRFLRHRLVTRHKVAFGRIRKPDFWGPVSPRLLERYRVRFTFGDFTALPFRPGSLDVVTCISVLEHMSPDARAQGVREMARVLKPGGRLLLTYDRHDDDLTWEIVDASGLSALELTCLQAGEPAASGRRRPDAVGLHLLKPWPAAAKGPVATGTF